MPGLAIAGARHIAAEACLQRGVVGKRGAVLKAQPRITRVVFRHGGQPPRQPQSRAGECAVHQRRARTGVAVAQRKIQCLPGAGGHRIGLAEVRGGAAVVREAQRHASVERQLPGEQVQRQLVLRADREIAQTTGAVWQVLIAGDIAFNRQAPDDFQPRQRAEAQVQAAEGVILKNTNAFRVVAGIGSHAGAPWEHGSRRRIDSAAIAGWRQRWRFRRTQQFLRMGRCSSCNRQGCPAQPSPKRARALATGSFPFPHGQCPP